MSENKNIKQNDVKHEKVEGSIQHGNLFEGVNQRTLIYNMSSSTKSAPPPPVPKSKKTNNEKE